MTENLYWGSSEDWRALELQRWETEVVSRFLSWYGWQSSASDLRRWERERTGRSCLSWEAVHARFPDYPAYFRCRTFPGLAKCAPLSRMFQRFADLPIVSAYAELLEDLPASAPPLAVLVFPWPRLQTRFGNAMTLHLQCESENSPGVWLSWMDRGQERPLVMEPLQRLVEVLGVRSDRMLLLDVQEEKDSGGDHS